jgi:glycine/D-amino acid oxidase-like deaminating enzyme
MDDLTHPQIMRRISENLPQHFPSSEVKDFDIIRDLVGIRPYRKNVRLEVQDSGGQRVLHAYGVGSGGFVFSWGLARQAVELVNKHLYALPMSSKL